MFKIVKGLEDPHVEQVFGMYGQPNETYTDESWLALHTCAKIHLDNVLVRAFHQAVDQFRTEIGVKRKDLKNVPLHDKFVVTSVLTGIYLDNWETTSPRWTGHQIQLEDVLLTFTGIEPDHIGDIEFIRRTAVDKPGIELVMKVKLNINPTTGVKYLIEKEDFDYAQSI